MNQKKLCDTLRDIVDQFGEEIVSENRLRGIICDYFPNNEEILHLMSVAISDHLGLQILGLRDLEDADFDLRIANIQQAFQERNFLRSGVAEYITQCYLFSLGWRDNAPDEDLLEDNASEGGGMSFRETESGNYCGDINETGEKSGFGVEQRDTSYYAGEWKMNFRHGLGIEIDEMQGKYAGEWNLNFQKGVGMKVFPDGRRYVGQWAAGKPNGPGMLFLPGGKCVSAVFCKGKMVESNGVCFLKDGSSIIGFMTEEGPRGECLHTYPDGNSEMEMW